MTNKKLTEEEKKVREKERKKRYREDNKEKIKAYNKKYKQENKEKIKAHIKEWGYGYREEKKEDIAEYKKEYYQRNKAKVDAKHKKYKEDNEEKVSQYLKEYNKKNKDKISANRRLYDSKRRQNPIIKLNQNISGGIRKSLKSQNLRKSGRHWENIVGYASQDLKEHLEGLFQTGMTWNNYGEWHIDHIVPISFFVYTSINDVEFKYCWSLNNLQPLWAEDNIRKKDKVFINVT